MKKIISLVMIFMLTIISVDAVSADFNELRPTFDIRKEWTVTFNKPIDVNSVNEETVNLKFRNLEGDFKFTYKLSKDKTKLTIIPKEDYKIGVMMLLIVNGVKSEDGKVLKNNISMEFAYVIDEPFIIDL